MTRREEYYGANDLLIMSKLEKKLKEVQMQIDNDSSVKKALQLYDDTMKYLESHDLIFWRELSEEAYLDFKQAKHLLKKPTRFLDKELEQNFINEYPDACDVSIDELKEYFNEGCQHSRYPHEFQFSCLQRHYTKAFAHIQANKARQQEKERLAAAEERQAQAKMLKELGLE